MAIYHSVSKYYFLVCLSLLLLNAAFAHTQVPAPRDILGFKPNSSQQVANWKQISNYFSILQEKSDRLKIENIGQSTESRDMFMAIISSPTNLMNLTLYRNLQKQAIKPGLTDSDIREISRKSKAVVAIVVSTTTEHIASSQAIMTLVYELISTPNKIIEEALSNILLLIIPTINPDGVDKIAAWFNHYANTLYATSRLPERAHSKLGDDIQFDWQSLKATETRLVAKQLFAVWRPHVVLELSGMNSNNIRARVAQPGAGVPEISPRISTFQEVLFADAVERAGLSGIESTYPEERQCNGSLALVACLHNSIGASLKVANTPYVKPLFFARGTLDVISPTAATEPAVKPWPGGWWHASDVSDYERAFVETLLTNVSRRKKEIIANFCESNRETINRSQQVGKEAFHISRKRNPKSTTEEFVDILALQGVKAELVTADKKNFSPGDYIIPRGQVGGNFLNFAIQSEQISSKSKLKSQRFTLSEKLGLTLDCVNDNYEKLQLKTVKVRPNSSQNGTSFQRRKKDFYLIKPSEHENYIAINRLLKGNKRVFRLISGTLKTNISEPGTFAVSSKNISRRKWKIFFGDLSVQLTASNEPYSHDHVLSIREPKVGLYQPWNADAEPGWTKFVLESHEFNMHSLNSAIFRNGSFVNDYDAIILPDLEPHVLLNGTDDDIYIAPPRSYNDGITQDGMINLKRFVRNGGTLISIGQSGLVLIDMFDLPLNVVEFDPSNTGLNEYATFATEANHNLTFGMPDNFKAYWSKAPIFRPKPFAKFFAIPVYCRSKFGKHRFDAPAALEFSIGDGRLILFTIIPHFRAQTANAFTLLFNAIYEARSERNYLQR